MRIDTRLTRFWTIHIRCSRRSATAALISGRMPLTHSCISHSNVTNVPERPTPALKTQGMNLYPIWWFCRVTTKHFKQNWGMSFPQNSVGLKVRPAVYHSRPQARGGIQILPHMVGEVAEWGWVCRDTPIWPGWVVVVCDYPVCWTVSLKHKHFPLSQGQGLVLLW